MWCLIFLVLMHFNISNCHHKNGIMTLNGEVVNNTSELLRYNPGEVVIVTCLPNPMWKIENFAYYMTTKRTAARNEIIFEISSMIVTKYHTIFKKLESNSTETRHIFECRLTKLTKKREVLKEEMRIRLWPHSDVYIGPFFKVNDLLLYPQKISSTDKHKHFLYEYYENERLNIGVKVENKSKEQLLKCHWDYYSVKASYHLTSLNDYPSVVVSALNRNRTGAKFICIYRDVRMTLHFVHDTFTDDEPYLTGISMSKTLLKYKPDERTTLIQSEVKRDEELAVNCTSKFPMIVRPGNGVELLSVSYKRNYDIHTFNYRSYKEGAFNNVSYGQPAYTNKDIYNQNSKHNTWVKFKLLSNATEAKIDVLPIDTNNTHEWTDSMIKLYFKLVQNVNEYQENLKENTNLENIILSDPEALENFNRQNYNTSLVNANTTQTSHSSDVQTEPNMPIEIAMLITACVLLILVMIASVLYYCIKARKKREGCVNGYPLTDNTPMHGSVAPSAIENEHVYETIPEPAYDYPYALFDSAGTETAVDISQRPPHPVPTEETEENKRYIHYDTPYEFRIFRMGVPVFHVPDRFRRKGQNARRLS